MAGAAAVAELIIRMRTETDKAAADVEKSGNKIDKVSAKFKGLAIPAAAAGAAVLAFGKSAADSASRTQQAMGAVDSVFGKNAGQIKKWASGAATSVGLAKSQYGELASVIGAQLKNMGLPMDQVTGKTNDLIKLGADLAATYGGTTAEAVEALSSTLRGETDPIEKYGVQINQAAIAAKQAEDGTKGLTGEAGKQAKTMATLALVSQQTADAHGQFARESDSASGSAQIASARYEDMKSALGTALLPAIAAVTSILGGLAKVVGEHPAIAQAAAIAILILAGAIMALVTAAKVYEATMIIVAAVQKAAWLSAAGPIILVVVAVMAVVAAIVILWQKSDAFRAVVLATWAAIQAAAVATWNAIKAAGMAVFNVLKAYVTAWATLTRAAFATVSAVASAVWSAIRTAVGAVSTAVSGLIGWLGRLKVPGAVQTAFESLKTAVGKVSTAVDTLTGWLAKIKVPSFIGSGFDTLATSIGRVIDKVESLIGWLGRIKVPKIHLPGGGGKAAPSSVMAMPVLPGSPVVMAAAPTAMASTGGASVVINISGAVDPEATARQLRRILSGSAIRHSNTTAARGLRTA
jgi:hypothetical protein